MPGSVGVLLAATVILFAIYRRYRRNVGRQRLSPKRMILRILLLCVAGVFLGQAVIVRPLALVEVLISLALGLAAAFVGLRLTKFERTSEGDFYTPNTYVSLAVFGIFIVRLAYRLIFEFQTGAPQAANGNPFLGYGSNPLVAAPFFLLVGYYAFYYGGVLLRSHALWEVENTEREQRNSDEGRG